MEEIEYEWAQKYEIVKRIDAALLDGNGNHRACISVPDTRRGTFMLFEIVAAFLSITAAVERMTVYACRSILEKRNFSFHR